MPRTDRPDHRRNWIIQRLPEPEYNSLVQHLEYVDLESGAVLYETNKERKHAYFPTSGLISVIEILEDGESSETAIIGREGMAGITTVLGGQTQPTRLVIQKAGGAYRISGERMWEEFKKGGVLMTQVLLYIQILYTHAAQTAVCNRHHNLQQQLSRWLLLCLDRTEEYELAITQESIASMLGVRREGITRAARALQNDGIIEYGRGMITVVDRQRLEETACECYRVIRRETERLIGIQKSRRSAH